MTKHSRDTRPCPFSAQCMTPWTSFKPELLAHWFPGFVRAVQQYYKILLSSHFPIAD
jgi:hypothetical protein